MIRIEGLRGAYNAGDRAGNYLAKAVDAGADFACGLYKAHPAALVNSPGNSFLRGVWDSLCGDRSSGLPPPPVPGTVGGQCEGRLYFWRLFYGEEPDKNTGAWAAVAPGKLRLSVGQFTPNTDDDPPIGQWEVTVYSNGEVVSPPDYVLGGVPSNQRPRLQTLPWDFGDDTCGDGEPQWPQSPPPPDGWDKGDTTIINNDGSSIKVPLGLVYAPITPTLETTFNIDVGGLSMKFDLGGVTVEPNGSGEPVSDIDDKLDILGDKLDDLGSALDNGGGTGGGGTGDTRPPTAPPPDSDPELDVEPRNVDDPKTETAIADLRYVKINLTKPPDKMHFGDGAPNCYFAGWMEFLSGEYAFPRQQINFIESIFSAPPGADGFAYTLTNGAEGYASIYIKKQDST